LLCDILLESNFTPKAALHQNGNSPLPKAEEECNRFLKEEGQKRKGSLGGF
jgi:hypothetical protein